MTPMLPMGVQPPTVASNAALSPEDQKKRMMIQLLQRPQLSAAPGGFEAMTNVLGSGVAGAAQGKYMKQQGMGFGGGGGLFAPGGLFGPAQQPQMQPQYNNDV